MDHRIDLEHIPGTDAALMRYNGEVIGKSRQPLYDAARWLQSSGHSLAGHTLTTWRNGKPSMHGSVDHCAQLTILYAPTGVRRAKWSSKANLRAEY